MVASVEETESSASSTSSDRPSAVLPIVGPPRGLLALDGKNSTELQKITQKHVFWGLTKSTEKHFYHLGYRG